MFINLNELDESNTIAVRQCETIVVGSGIAGLSAALHLQDCTLLTAGSLGVNGSTPWAQGGIAAAVSPDDSSEDHAQDTMAVSAGLSESTIAKSITSAGPAAIEQLVALGAKFDRSDDGQLLLGHEAGHRRNRIVRANGDAIGAEIIRTLTAAVLAEPAVEIVEETYAIDLLINDQQQVSGVLAKQAGEVVAFLAPDVVLATGGYAYCYRRSTNPRGSIGSGIAMADRAGAQLADMEFVQFHPTALLVQGDSRLPLLTEAIRGEGAILINKNGERYMQALHKDGELAPRDVVARGNYWQLQKGNEPQLDASEAVGSRFPRRFPTVYALAQKHGFDPQTQPLPVTPAAHYTMGGVATDATGRSSIKGLWAVGETSSSGLHGANRLASNSLLEGFVMGSVVADAIAGQATRRQSPVFSQLFITKSFLPFLRISFAQEPATIFLREAEEELRTIVWDHVGVTRSYEGLTEAAAKVAALAERIELQGWSLRLRDMVNIVENIVAAALRRPESCGAHYMQ